MKKKILYLSQVYPYPADGGGKIKTLQTLRALAREFDIHAVFVSEYKPSKKDLQELHDLSIKVNVFYSDRVLASVKDDLVDLANHFIRGIPHYVFQYLHKNAYIAVQEIIKLWNPDIIHVDHLNMSQYLPKEKNQIWLLEHHNVETHLYWTRFIHTGRITRKIYLFIEMMLTFFYEWKTLRHFDHILAISDKDTKRLQNIFRVEKVSTQPMVYPVHPVNHKRAKHPYILFIGNLGWPPNEDAVGWFLKDVFPKIIKQIPDAQFHVVGKRQPRYEKDWVIPRNVFLHGYQKNLDPFLSNAYLCVLPFRMGGGLRLKCLTALSAGVPVVSTSLGIDGIKIRHGVEC